jgi:fido (protein-threonine AMPylation protein)
MPDSASGYKWKEISDLPADIDSLRDRELGALFQAWLAEKERFDESQVKDFSDRLAREWAIETGIIEDVYTLDSGITQTLIERGIDSSFIPHDGTNGDPELVARIIQAHAEVLDGLFDFVTGQRDLTVGYVKELHAALLRHVSKVVVFDQFGNAFETQLEKGQYKRLPNNPKRPDGAIHEYCPPEYVASEMDRLIQLHQQHEELSVAAHIEAAWLHHAFTQIHPFQDGNGRVARALASLVFIKHGFFPLVVNRDDRTRYIDALEAADVGSLEKLTGLFSRIQKRSLTKAIGHAADVRPAATLEEALAVTRDMLVNLGRIAPAEHARAKDVAAQLQNDSGNRLFSMGAMLNKDIARVDSRFSFVTANIVDAFPVDEIRSLGEQLHYDLGNRDYFHCRVLEFRVGTVQSRITVSFHIIGPAFRGLIGVLAYFTHDGGLPAPLCEDIFTISYNEPADQVGKRFSVWLDKCLIEGLAAWRRTLV